MWIRILTPQTDEASERTIRNVIQILWAIVQPDQKDWAMKLPMMEFVINLSISSSTGFMSFKLNYWYMPTLMQCINEGKPLIAPDVKMFIQKAKQNLEMAHNAIIESYVVQVYHANKQ